MVRVNKWCMFKWQDAYRTCTSWTPRVTALEDINKTTECCVIETVGLLLKKTKEHYVVAMSYDRSTDSVSELMVIPSKMILEAAEIAQRNKT